VRVVLIALLFGVAACTNSGSSSSSSSATNAPGSTGTDVAHGKQVFDSNCQVCHGAGGQGGGVGPKLTGERSRKNVKQAVDWIKNPQPPMPKLYPSPLRDKDVADVAAYVESL